MRTELLFHRILFALLTVAFFSVQFTSAQTTKQTPQQPKKGKLVIVQDQEVSKIVKNTKPTSTTPPTASTASPAKQADKTAKPVVPKGTTDNSKSPSERTAPVKTEKKEASSPATAKPSEQKKEVDNKKEAGSPTTNQPDNRNATKPQPDKVAEQKMALEKERDRERKERAEEADKGYYSGMVRTRYKARGFRIQVYTGGNTRNHKAQAYAIAGKTRQIAPELSTYVQFQSPHWICRVGDFRNREDANRYARRLRSAGVSNETRVVSCEVLLAR